MKRIILSVLVTCGLYITAVAQGTSALEQLCARMTENSALLNYSYTLSVSGVKTVGDGVLYVQDQSYVMQGSGLKIYCNGSTVWLVDEAGKEVMIESVSHDADSYLSNPVLLLANIEAIFSVSSPSVNGPSLTYKLAPKSDCGIASGVVTISSAGGISPVFTSGSFKMSDGGQLDVKIKSMTFSSKKPLTFYTLDLSTFDSSWMITDLR
jgi:hypothetical protein